MAKKRLDVLIVEKGLAESRQKAQALIMSGNVYVNGQKEDKAGTAFGDGISIEIRGGKLPFVSRGGLKLDKALKVFDVNVEGKVCIDIGASTGGFTDCMLQNGAEKVYAVDVGYGQFSWKLRQDERVICLEKTNVRYITDEQIPEPLEFGGCDVSFISLTKILPAVRPLMTDDAHMVCLIKPQFEAGREKVGKKGVVREPEVHIEVIEMITDFALHNGFTVAELSFSPIRGPEGNIEYLIHLIKSDDPALFENVNIGAVVSEAHANDWSVKHE